MIKVKLSGAGEHWTNPLNFVYPIYNPIGNVFGFSTHCDDEGRGVTGVSWCSLEIGQIWLNTDTDESIELTPFMFRRTREYGRHVLTAEGLNAMMAIINGKDDSYEEPDSDMPDIF